MTSMTIAERMLHCATRLKTYKGGQLLAYGTGFYYRLDRPGGHSILLMTNKHVFQGATRIVLIMHYADPADPSRPSGRVGPMEVLIWPELVVNHPDKHVDLCAVNISSDLGKGSKRNGPPFYVALGPENMPGAEDAERIDAIEEVTMVGCPKGIYDEKNNIPIVRRGITATPITRSFNGKPEFVVDMACYGGSSGSPVFLHNRDGYFDRKTNSFVAGKQRLFLVGVLYGGPLFTNSGQVVIAHEVQVAVTTPMHLGYCISHTEVKALADLYEPTVQSRRKT